MSSNIALDQRFDKIFDKWNTTLRKGRLILETLAKRFGSIAVSSSKNLLNLTKSQSKILEDLPWNIRPVVLNSFVGDFDERSKTKGEKKGPGLRRNNIDLRNVGILAQITPGDELLSSEESVGISRANSRSRTDTKSEFTMKSKVFSLMYETVRDTDAKVKRAEQIKEYYANNTEFEMGYLMGEATDKYNSMMEVAATVKRLYKEWKPLDHINAYEQIANQAIQITTVIDMILKTNSELNQESDTAQATRVARTRQKFRSN